MTDESAEFYIVDEPEYFCEGQTTLDGYIWEKCNGMYVKAFMGGWNERSH